MSKSVLKAHKCCAKCKFWKGNSHINRINSSVVDVEDNHSTCHCGFIIKGYQTYDSLCHDYKPKFQLMYVPIKLNDILNINAESDN